MCITIEENVIAIAKLQEVREELFAKLKCKVRSIVEEDVADLKNNINAGVLALPLSLPKAIL